MKRLILLFCLAISFSGAQDYTLGVGVYPGDPKENFAPSRTAAGDAYRNLALRRPAYQSSSYDYNLTAQLATDGVIETGMPRWIATATSRQPVLPRHERERFLDGNVRTWVDLAGASAWVQVELGGGEIPLAVDRIRLAVQARAKGGEEWTATVLSSEDGKTWNPAGRAGGAMPWDGQIEPTIVFSEARRSRYWRVEFESAGAQSWRVAEVSLFHRNEPVRVAGPHMFASAWMSAGKGQEWVYVDLGPGCRFDRVVLHWLRRPAEGSLQVSDDAQVWKTLTALPSNGLQDEVKLPQPVAGRYVRVLMMKPATPDGYVLTEFEVFGRGGEKPVPKPAFAGGAWRVERASLVKGGGRAVATAGFQDDDWVPATVPGTVLVSYLNAGALPDPNFGDNQLNISDSFFYSDFWYRTEFVAPPVPPGRHMWLDFGGINWKAEVFLNGEKLGRIEGAFMRGRFEVTRLLRPGAKNALAVLIEKNATPGSVKEKTVETPDKNGGALGADNPTYHASIGWDWIPTIRGRNTGIWDAVTLSSTGPVRIENPFVKTGLRLPDLAQADVSLEVTLRNQDARPVSGILRGRFGEAAFETRVALEAGSEKVVRLDPASAPALRLKNPKLWWPAGYGEPNLYNVKLEFATGDGAVSDAAAFQAGVRRFTYSEEGGALRLWINGRRFVPRGGNWGFGESMLRYRAREYDTAVRYHADMHFNMIRNWVGQIGDDAFYEACDRRGVVVWQDFWLANPADGPDPDDHSLFLGNARDMLLRIRNHPSIGLYCGRNEGYPPRPLDEGLRKLLAELTADSHYISSSADDVVSGHGPYRAMPDRYYFEERATPRLHSEMGMPNVMNIESVRMAMPEASLWPQGQTWALHDFSFGGAQNGAAFREMVEMGYGPAADAAEWTRLAQFVNYAGHRAMFEAQGRNRMGLLMWMSHPCWPSFVWQTYDYFFEPTAAYFGAKKASEPLHIQWNPVADQVEVVNYSAGRAAGLVARAQLINIDGAVKWEKTAPVDSAEDSTVSAIRMEHPAGLTHVYFLRLGLFRDGKVLSENFYWRGKPEGDYRALRHLPAATLAQDTKAERDGGRWVLTAALHNTSKTPAAMVRLKVVREKTGDRILPALYSDNYVWLMPGENRTVTVEVRNADTRGERPRIVLEGLNLDGAR